MESTTPATPPAPGTPAAEPLLRPYLDRDRYGRLCLELDVGGDPIVVGDPRSPDAVIEVVAVRGCKVKIAVCAPRHTPVNREKVAWMKLASGEIAP
jgi:hypothetical protein